MRNKLSKGLALIALIALGAGAYLVKKGDTLWDLSATYLQNPFAWPDLWQKNMHIRDPHWIYPGDSLFIPGLDGDSAKISIAQVPEATASPVPDSLLPKGVVPTAAPISRDEEFRRNLGSLPDRAQSGTGLRKDTTIYLYREREIPAVFNLYYQVLAPQLIDTAQYRKDPDWMLVRHGEKTPSLLLHTGDEILLRRGKKSGLRPESVLGLWLVDRVEVQPSLDSRPLTQMLVRLAGFAKIASVGDSLSRAHIVQTMSAMPLDKIRARPFVSPAILQVQGYQEIPQADYESMARVYYAPDPSLTVGIYAYVLIDRGTSSNFKPGNAVAIWEQAKEDPGLPPRLIGRGIVVSALANQSCVLVRELYSPSRRIAQGSRVSLTHQAVIP